MGQFVFDTPISEYLEVLKLGPIGIKYSRRMNCWKSDWWVNKIASTFAIETVQTMHVTTVAW